MVACKGRTALCAFSVAFMFMSVFLSQSASAQDAPAVEISKLVLTGKGFAVSPFDPLEVKSFKIVVAQVSLLGTEQYLGVIALAGVKYRLADVEFGSGVLSARVKGASSETGNIKLMKINADDLEMWAGTLTMGQSSYNIYVVGSMREFTNVEKSKSVEEYCKENPNDQKCAGITTDYCLKNPDERRCAEILNKYCSTTNAAGDVRCKKTIVDYCSGNPSDVQCAKPAQAAAVIDCDSCYVPCKKDCIASSNGDEKAAEACVNANCIQKCSGCKVILPTVVQGPASACDECRVKCKDVCSEKLTGDEMVKCAESCFVNCNNCPQPTTAVEVATVKEDYCTTCKLKCQFQTEPCKCEGVGVVVQPPPTPVEPTPAPTTCLDALLVKCKNSCVYSTTDQAGTATSVFDENCYSNCKLKAIDECTPEIAPASSGGGGGTAPQTTVASNETKSNETTTTTATNATGQSVMKCPEPYKCVSKPLVANSTAYAQCAEVPGYYCPESEVCLKC